MVKAFSLLDVPLLYSLRGQGTYLDLEGVLCGFQPPLLSALAGLLSLSEAGAPTYVLAEEVNGQPLRGFVQGRAGGAECDVLFIAPAMPASGESPQAGRIWHALLEHLCVQQGEQGVQRIFVKVRDDGSAAAETLRQLGFGAYARRHVFRLANAPAKESPSAGSPLRPRRPEDDWGLQRLYSTVAPRPIQQAEGFDRQAEGPTSAALYGFGREPARDWLSERYGETTAYFRLLPGRWGHWLTAMLHPDLRDEGIPLLRAALSLFSEMPRRPLYCGAREYEVGLKHALIEVGFQPYADELIMVKHTTGRVEASAFELALELGKKAKRVPTVSESRQRARDS